MYNEKINNTLNTLINNTISTWVKLSLDERQDYIVPGVLSFIEKVATEEQLQEAIEHSDFLENLCNILMSIDSCVLLYACNN